eukprot:1524443-Alexandrium_andersonii.AAC.1
MDHARRSGGGAPRLGSTRPPGQAVAADWRGHPGDGAMLPAGAGTKRTPRNLGAGQWGGWPASGPVAPCD